MNTCSTVYSKLFRESTTVTTSKATDTNIKEEDNDNASIDVADISLRRIKNAIEECHSLHHYFIVSGIVSRYPNDIYIDIDIDKLDTDDTNGELIDQDLRTTDWSTDRTIQNHNHITTARIRITESNRIKHTAAPHNRTEQNKKEQKRTKKNRIEHKRTR